MATNPSLDAATLNAAVGAAVRRHRKLYLFEGILLSTLGVPAVLLPAIATFAATLFFGWILLLSGAVGLFTTLRGRQLPGFGWALLSAIVGIVAGGLLLAWPLQGTFSLTSVLIAFLLVEGAVTIFYALEHRTVLPRWGVMLASGIVDLILGIILFAGLPGTAVWALGLLIGINMIFGGWALIFMALSAPPA
ncbi:MAG TPA: HdeD family acid-resistance protein [Steroidobacteraceae bacterium]|nr:HdeD family acid-resistance protein [Steroidobacteraceae bacterium]